VVEDDDQAGVVAAEMADDHSTNRASNECVGKRVCILDGWLHFGLWSLCPISVFFCVECIKRMSWYVLIVGWRLGLWQLYLGLGRSCHVIAARSGTYWGIPQMSGRTVASK
jgi:hypothetical protein